MKAIIFCFCFVLSFFHPTHSCALDAKYTFNFEIVQQKSICLFTDSKSENQFFDIDLLEDEDNDEVSSSHWMKFSSKKKAFPGNFLNLKINDFADNFSKRILPNRYFFHLHPAHFISLRVLRI